MSTYETYEKEYNGFIIVSKQTKSSIGYFVLNKDSLTKVNNIAIGTIKEAEAFVDSLNL